MKKLITLGLIITFVFSGILVAPEGRPVYAGNLFIPDAKNKECPVTGKPIKKKRYYSLYKGKRYWFDSYEAVAMFEYNEKKYEKKIMELEAKKNKVKPVRSPGVLS